MTQESYQQKFMRWVNQMHFDAQPKAQSLYKTLLITVAIISYIVSFIFQRFSICIYSMLVTTVICIIVVVPGQLPFWQRQMPKFAKQVKEKTN